MWFLIQSHLPNIFGPCEMWSRALLLSEWAPCFHFTKGICISGCGYFFESYSLHHLRSACVGIFNFLFLNFHLALFRFGSSFHIMCFRIRDGFLVPLRNFIFWFFIFIIGFGLFSKEEGTKTTFSPQFINTKAWKYFEELKQMPRNKLPWKNYSSYVNVQHKACY